MKFANLKINETDYWNKICDLLNDEKCYIFIDTNILSFIYKLHKDARIELYDFFDNLKTHNRLKIPSWVAHEYNSKIKANNLSQYNGIRKQSETILKEINELKKGLFSYIDDFHLEKNTLPQDRSIYLNDVMLTINSLSEQLKALNSGKESNNIAIIQEEIQNKLEECILSSNIFGFVKKAEAEFPSRLKNRISPGFKDKNKEENIYGDYIIWQEILLFCTLDIEENQKPDKILFITKDTKTDWVYSPQKKIDMNGRIIPNNSPKLFLANPDLQLEYTLITDSDDFYILDIEQLVMGLLKNGSQYHKLANAVQIEYEEETTEEDAEVEEETTEEDAEVEEETIEEDAEVEEETTEEDAEIEEETTEEDAEVEEETTEEDAEIEEETTEEDTEVEEETIERMLKTLSIYPISDENYKFKNDNISKIVDDLKSLNWYIQNPAIKRIYKLNEDIGHNDSFILGRNIYQSACGGSLDAYNLIVNFDNKLSSFKFKEDLLNGMLFEIYFDKYGKLRTDFKLGCFEEVVNLLDKYKDSKDFIKKILNLLNIEILEIQFEDDLELEVKFDYTHKCISDITFCISGKNIIGSYVEEKIKNDLYKPSTFGEFKMLLMKKIPILGNKIIIKEMNQDEFLICKDYIEEKNIFSDMDIF